MPRWFFGHVVTLCQLHLNRMVTTTRITVVTRGPPTLETPVDYVREMRGPGADINHAGLDAGVTGNPAICAYIKIWQLTIEQIRHL